MSVARALAMVGLVWAHRGFTAATVAISSWQRAPRLLQLMAVRACLKGVRHTFTAAQRLSG